MQEQTQVRSRLQAEQWFLTELHLGGFFNEHVLAALRRHQRAEHLIILVSGSFRACLAPIARRVAADLVICSEPDIISGVYTGRIHQPMVGDAKANAVHDLATLHRIHLPSSTAYGDHPSDLPLLHMAGHATIVGSDPVMQDWVHRRRWRLLPDAPPAPPLLLPSSPLKLSRGWSC